MTLVHVCQLPKLSKKSPCFPGLSRTEQMSIQQHVSQRWDIVFLHTPRFYKHYNRRWSYTTGAGEGEVMAQRGGVREK